MRLTCQCNPSETCLHLEALALNHSLANLIEPKSTEEATNRVVRILDANYKKAHLQEVVKDNCTHLSANEQKQLLVAHRF